MIVLKPWGSYEVLSKGSNFDNKILKVNPGFNLSLQFHGSPTHPGHSEQWVCLTDIVVVKGLNLDNLTVKKYKTGEIVNIASGELHALCNPFKFPIEVEETRTSPVSESPEDREENIVRLYDQFHRDNLPDFPDQLKQKIQAVK